MTPTEKADFLTILLEETIGTSPHSRETIKEILLQMHQWTDQQRIDKTIKWLEEQDFGGWIESETEDLINDFKQSVKEEL